MIRTKAIITNVNDISSAWIFERYCPISEKLIGQDVKIKSVFNPNDSVPSMSIFCKGDTYYYKDFSTDRGGSAIDFIMEYHKISYAEACDMIIKDYQNYLINSNGVENIERKIVQKVPYTLENYEIRKWNKADAEYWQQYKISSDTLEKYKVFPLKSYTFSKSDNGEYEFIKTEKQYLYGFFRQDGSLYKIYQPKNLEKKFMQLQPYIHGLDQLEYKSNILIITSSLKDGMCLISLGLPIEFVAPYSEGSIISLEMIEYFKTKYSKIIVILDNDTAGIKAMERYKALYNLPYIILQLSKDISDSVKDHGVLKTKKEIVNLIKNQLL